MKLLPEPQMYPEFDPQKHTVQVIEKWGPGYYLKYIPLPNGEVIILESGPEPPFAIQPNRTGAPACVEPVC